MQTFEEILTEGGHTNSLGRAKEVFDIVKAQPDQMHNLFQCIYSDDAWVRMRAIDTFEKLVRENPTLARPFTKLLVTDLTNSSQPSVQWHLAQLFTEIELSQAQRTQAVAWLRERIQTTGVDWIVAVNVMKALLFFRRSRQIEDSDLRQLFNIQTKHTSKSVRKKADQFLLVLPSSLPAES